MPPLCALLTPPCGAAETSAAGTAGSEIDILSQWTGTESEYRERPSCFLVRSVPELQVFWEKHAPDEPMPRVDFEKRMLFVWVSGPSLSGYHVMEAVRVVRKRQGYILELDIRRSDSAGAGQWRNPWLMALLPKFRGDIEVVRIGDAAAGEAERMPFAVIHDMGGAQAETAVTKVSASGGAAQGVPSAAPAVSGAGGGAKPAVSAAKPVEEKPVVAASAQPAARPVETTGSPADAAPAGQPPSENPAAGTASADADPFGDAFNLDL